MPIISTYPDFIHKEQQHIIGEEHPDRLGDKWAYVEFKPGTYKEGHIVKDEAATTVATVSAVSAKGTNVLHDTGAFANLDLRGAIGHITEGGGAGQIFQVLTHDNDKLIVAVNNSEEAQRGWNVALTTSSKYRLRVVGRVELAGASEYYARGAVQYPDSFTVPAGEFRYGYVRKNGIGAGRLDADGDSILANGLIIPAAGGLIVGVPSTLTIAALSQVIGQAVAGDDTSATDVTVPVDFRIKNNARSFRRPKKREDPTFTVE